MTPWTVTLRGGAYDGWSADCHADIKPLLIAWECPGDERCDGHLTFSPQNPGIVLKTAESYVLAEQDMDRRTAVYEVGAVEPGEEFEREVVVTLPRTFERVTV